MPKTIQSSSQSPPQSLQTKFCGLTFNTPLVALSGCVGFGDEYTRVEGYSDEMFGAVCLKGITLEPRLGNPPRRITETHDGMINAIGLQNPGVDAFVKEVLPALDFKATRYIANISGVTVDEYAQLAKRLDDSPIDAIEINVSCPNVKEGGLEFGNSHKMSAQVVEACRSATSKPLIVKLSPNQADIAGNARACLEAGADAFAAINTVRAMAIDIKERCAEIGIGQGGLSGPAIKPIALYSVWSVYKECRKHDIPIIGQGGVAGTEDAIEFLLAGATAVGVGTGLFYDPLLGNKIQTGIADYLKEHGMKQVSELVGALSNPPD